MSWTLTKHEQFYVKPVSSAIKNVGCVLVKYSIIQSDMTDGIGS